MKRSIAVVEVLLILPATLFMLSLFLRNVQPSPYQPAETARELVDWFAARPHIGLQLLLIALPFAALIIGIATSLRSWRSDTQLRQAVSNSFAALRAHGWLVLITAATLLAGVILSIVALHIISD